MALHLGSIANGRVRFHHLNMRFLIHQTRDYPKTVKEMTSNDLFQHLTELVFIRLQSPCSQASFRLSFVLRGHLRLTHCDRQKQH